MPCPVCGANATLFAGEIASKYACGFTAQEIARGMHQDATPRGTTFFRSDKRALVALGIIGLAALAYYVTVADLPDHSIAAARSGDAFEFTIKNEADGPIAYLLEVDGVESCLGELGTRAWNNRATCTSPVPYGRGAEADLLLTVERSTGRAYQEIHGNATAQATLLLITNFGAREG